MATISPGTVSVPESGPSWLAPLDWMLTKDLAGLCSLDAPEPHMRTMADVLGAEDPQMEHMLGMQAVANRL